MAYKKDTRRIGGLEKNKTDFPPRLIDTRRIGGLEMSKQ